MRFVCAFFAFSICTIFFTKVSAQDTKIILNNYIKFRTRQLDTLYNYLVQSRKSDWLAKIPSPTYSTRTGFGLSFSLQSIASYRQTKQRNQIELERLKFQMQSELDKEIQQLEIQIDQLFADADKLKIAIKNFETYENQIHDIEQGKYQNNQSTLKEWLTYKKSYEERKNNLQAERTAIINKLSAMATKTKSPEEFQGLIKIFTNLTF